MTCSAETREVQRDAPISTWFGVGGCADALVVAQSDDDLRWAIETGEPVRVLGEGANLLVADEGVGGIVVSLASDFYKQVEIDPRTHLVHAGAGVDLRRLITLTSNAGLSGLEVLGGIPASVGGAVRMNAGGAFGQICTSIARVHAIDKRGRSRVLEAAEIDFGYRRSGLDEYIITKAEFALLPDDVRAIRARFRACMEKKSVSQPMAASSAGCAFKNPMLIDTLEDIAPAGARVSAGLLIDRSGCKGLRCRGAEVSSVHANFLVAHPGARANDLLVLMLAVEERVFDRFGVRLEREVVVWSREP
ncbi:MAG: UDP-N-acetylmuramate dehydrogenase [Phycisphaeraceae bacterium]|nr:UDP-N-acetylmuramate dehydrogenase [Phycisphaeraceae bacterium]MCW5761717.1 UDP-N-acetylmuramate dehydrogenase [Phycisphaeraceae bacterium]